VTLAGVPGPVQEPDGGARWPEDRPRRPIALVAGREVEDPDGGHSTYVRIHARGLAGARLHRASFIEALRTR
jgi:hypothetical protein